MTKAENELKRLEGMIRKIQKVTDLHNEAVALVSHEMKTAITALTSWANYLLRENKGMSRSQIEILEHMKANIQRVETLTSELLTVASFEKGELKLFKYPVSIEKIVTRVVDTYKTIADEHRVSIKFLRPKEPLPEIRVDYAKIKEAISNIVDNAIRFNKDGGSVEIKLKKLRKNVQISIRDTGIGIPKKDLPYIFRKFYKPKEQKAGEEKRHESEGTGLGLYIVRLIVEAHGGKVSAKSKAGVGSTFTIELPILTPTRPSRPNR